MTPTPGLHPNMGNDEYHSHTDWWSSTQLKAFLPEQYKPFAGNTDALTFGTLVHELVLEPDLHAKYVPLDAAKIGVKADGTPAANPLMTTAWKKAVADVEQNGHIPVAQTDWDKAHAMIDALHAHPEAADLLWGVDGVNEESAFWIDDDGLQHKARFDKRISGAVIDLKTTSAAPGEHSLTRACIDYGYELSAAHYLEVADGLELDAHTFIHVWVSKTTPYRVTVTELDHFFIERGRHLRRLALDRALNRLDPYDGATGRLILTPPAWADLTDEMEIA